MPALNFSMQFVTAVQSGRKRQTIRAQRKVPIKAGDKLYFYTGMRSKACRKLGEAVCTAVEPIRMGQGPGRRLRVWIGERELTDDEIEALAHADGFDTTEDMRLWFVLMCGHSFSGQLIRW
jgi:hypothetical protein